MTKRLIDVHKSPNVREGSLIGWASAAFGEKDLWNGWVLSVEWKSEEVWRK